MKYYDYNKNEFKPKVGDYVLINPKGASYVVIDPLTTHKEHSSYPYQPCKIIKIIPSLNYLTLIVDYRNYGRNKWEVIPMTEDEVLIYKLEC